VWSFDEGRFGLKVWFRRRWCPRGFRPPWLVQDRYEWLWLYAAVEPLTGDSFFLLLPYVNSECLQLFLNKFADYVKDDRVGCVLDGHGSHVSEGVRWPEHVIQMPLPPYSPELNPAEAVFRHLRAELSNRIFDNLDELEAAITAALRPFWDQPAKLQRLVGYPWWTAAAAAITKESA